MTELSPRPEAGTRIDIDPASVGLVTIDTGTAAIASCNDAFACLVGCRATDVLGCRIPDFVDDEVQSIATAVMEGVRAGIISSVDGNVELSRPAGPVGVDCWILALGGDRPHEAAIAGAVPAHGAAPCDTGTSELGLRPAHIDPTRIVLATLDDDGRVVDVAPGSAGQLGWPEPGATTVMPRLQELAHPGDASSLDGCFGRRTWPDTPDAFSLRLRGADGQWLSARVAVSPLCGHGAATSALVACLQDTEEPGDDESERVARLEDQLARIRRVVQPSNGDGTAGTVELGDLTIRQREIVERLLDGHRVDAIARDLYVSPSTVRNHLSAIFEKLGVASQSELVELLRRHATSDSETV